MFTIPIEPVLAFLMILMRVFFLLSFMPVYGDVFTPLRVRALVSIAISLALASVVRFEFAFFPDSLPGLVVLLLPEAFLGMLFGLIGRLLFGAVQFAGTVIGEQVGFNMASMVDPTQAGQMPVVGQILFLGMMLVFLGVGGDQQAFLALARSYSAIPPGSITVPEGLFAFINDRASEMFVIAVQLSLPIIAATFITNVGMGMLTKAVPKIHIFIESFPIRIMLGLFLLSILSNFLVYAFVQRIGFYEDHLAALLRLLKG